MDSGEPLDPAVIAGLTSLDDPARRRLYDYVVSSSRPVSRDDAARAAGIGRTLAAYHLDKLAEAGLVSASYSRPAGRGGPGAGRPAKRYVPAAREMSVSVPPRDYALLAQLLAAAIETDASDTVREALGEAARTAGRRAGGECGGDLLAALRRSGYRPGTGHSGQIELRNCPFHSLAERHRDLVCGLNLHLVGGMTDVSREQGCRAVLDPAPGRCCVLIRTDEEGTG